MVPPMIHDDHPFQDPPDERDPVRQFRGRLVAPVTVVTAGGEDSWAGLTVSSLMVAEGDPASVLALIGPTTDLWEQMEATETFVVHILDDAQREHGDAFAGTRPRPGGPFAEVEVTQSPWGPVLDSLHNRLFCRLADSKTLPFHQLVEGLVEKAEVADLDDPATYFRGGYRRLEKK
jgi:flavin reductase (DIM6/NTAB) family NADH-FMN oxidoreductase RutF